MADLTDDDRAMLALAGSWWRNRGAYERAIVETFGWTPLEYFRRLNRLVDDPAALAAAPVLVARLRRLRDAGVRARLGVGYGAGAAQR